MYLHIGNDVCVKTKDIIGIFDIESIKKASEYEEIIKSLADNVIDIAGKRKKSLILTLENNQKKGYISNILSTTLEKRVKANFNEKEG